MTKLILYLGESQAEHGSWDGNSRPRNTACNPDGAFWSPYVDGITFPSLRSIEIHHYWATVPPQGSSLLDQAKICKYPSISLPFGRYNAGHWSGPYRRFGYEILDNGLAGTGSIGACPGLEKLEEIYLESPPELNSPLLMQILDNRDSKANSLRKLEIRFCHIEIQTVAMLLQQEVATLKQFTLLIGYKDSIGYTARHQEPSPHLCPLLRQFSKNLVELRFAACHVCRELFFDEEEIQCLKESSVTNNITSFRRATDIDINIDRHAIHQTVSEYRTKKKLCYRNARIADAVAEAKGRNLPNPDSTIKVEAELQLDQEEHARSRKILDSKVPWKRSIISWEGICDDSSGWAELQEGANTEEEGIDWVLTSGLFRFH